MEPCVGCGEKRFRHIQIDVEKCCSNKSELASYAVLWKGLKRKNPQRKKNKECKSLPPHKQALTAKNCSIFTKTAFLWLYSSWLD